MLSGSMTRQEFDELAKDICLSYNPEHDLFDSIYYICFDIVIHNKAGHEVERFRKILQFRYKHGFFPHQLSFRFTQDDIQKSVVRIDNQDVYFRFCDDFSETAIQGNGYQICERLVTLDIVSKEKCDPESGLVWIYFQAFKQGAMFIDRLNKYLDSIEEDHKHLLTDL